MMAEGGVSGISCFSCKKLLKDPRILPCAHSFCFKCLESLCLRVVDVPRCPVCETAFEIPEGGLVNLKKNEFLEQLNKLSIDRETCQSCDECEAVNFCLDCSFYYCSTCLQYHEKNPSSRNHRLYRKKDESIQRKMSRPNAHEICKDHNEILNLYCEDCNIFACGVCFTTNHKPHEMENISKKFNEMKDYLDFKIKSKENEFKIVTGNFESADLMLSDCKTKAGELRTEIQQRGEDMKKVIDIIVSEMNEEVERELKKHEEEIRDIKTKLKEMENDLNAQIETLKQIRNNLNYSNIVGMSFEKSDDKLYIPTYSNDFKMFITTSGVNRKSTLEELMGFLRKKLRPEFCDDPSFKDSPELVAACREKVYVYCCKTSQIDIYDASEFVYKSSIHLGDLLCSLNDMEVIDGFLFISGKELSHHLVIFKIVISDEGGFKPFGIYRNDDCSECQLSKTSNGHLIVSLNDKILRIISQDGCVMEMITCPFDILHSVQLDDNHFVICGDSNLCIVDHNGLTKSSYSPTDKTNKIEYANYLAIDNLQNIFVSGYFEDRVFVFDRNISLVGSFEIGATPLKIVYNECTNSLLVLTEPTFGDEVRRLMIFKL